MGPDRVEFDATFAAKLESDRRLPWIGFEEGLTGSCDLSSRGNEDAASKVDQGLFRRGLGVEPVAQPGLQSSSGRSAFRGMLAIEDVSKLVAT